MAPADQRQQAVDIEEGRGEADRRTERQQAAHDRHLLAAVGRGGGLRSGRRRLALTQDLGAILLADRLGGGEDGLIQLGHGLEHQVAGEKAADHQHAVTTLTQGLRTSRLSVP